MKIAHLSPDPWDGVWRRNQHLAAGLVDARGVESVLYVEPPVGGLAVRAHRHRPRAGLEVVTPPLLVPRTHGGHRVLAAWLRRTVCGADVLWVNDPVAGSGVLPVGLPALYDVTDDWRTMPQSAAQRARIVAAEDALADAARTVVCSEVLAARWRERYGVDAAVVRNGVDVAAVRRAAPRPLAGCAPHLVYIGTLHANRIDGALVAALTETGTVHLIGPDHLEPDTRRLLVSAGVRLYGAVPFEQVPSWLVSADVLLCPHVVDDFTLSLDAIKAHEYLATDRPIVATPTSGFQSITAPGLAVVGSGRFADAVRAATSTGRRYSRLPPCSWRERVNEFAAVLKDVADANACHRPRPLPSGGQT
jgi:teichuronic acid biosynthesis glycosyltransferase TuaH